jgi:hypothetical protein
MEFVSPFNHCNGFLNLIAFINFLLFEISNYESGLHKYCYGFGCNINDIIS